jgi:hypothetical protein
MVFPFEKLAHNCNNFSKNLILCRVFKKKPALMTLIQKVFITPSL